MEAVQRLEELAVDLDCEELQGIANALDLQDGKDCPKCQTFEKDRQFLSELFFRLEQMGYGRNYRSDHEYRNRATMDSMRYLYQSGIGIGMQVMPKDVAKMLDTGP